MFNTRMCSMFVWPSYNIEHLARFYFLMQTIDEIRFCIVYKTRMSGHTNVDCTEALLDSTDTDTTLPMPACEIMVLFEVMS